MTQPNGSDAGPRRRLERTLERIKEAAHECGRTDPIQLVAVSKTRSPLEVKELVLAGQNTFGENRVQELLEKQTALPSLLAGQLSREIKWHLIGSLQRNKVNKVVGRVALIQSVDSVELAELISSRASDLGLIQPILLQVNSSREQSKSGFEPAELVSAARHIAALPGIELHGLMMIGPLTQDNDKVRASFRLTRELSEEARRVLPDPAHWKTISMGMSEDLEIAVEEGSNMVRIGRALFGDL